MRDEPIYQFSPDGTRVAVASPDGRLTIWNTNSEVYQQYSPSAHLSAQITTMAWCPASHLKTPKKNKKEVNESTADIIALGTSAGTVVLYSVRQGDAVTTFEAALSTIRINSVVWSNSCKSVIVGAQDGMVTIFSVIDLKLLVRINTGKEPVYAVAVTHDDKRIISGSRKLQVWEVRKQILLQTFIGHANEVRRLSCIDLNEESFVLSAAEDDRNISVWRLEERDKPKKSDPAYATLAVNQTVSDIGSLKMSEEELLTSVTTEEGSVEIYRYSLLNKAKTKPYKPVHTIQIMSETEDKVLNVPILANILRTTDQLTLSIAYGSESKLQLEELKISELRKKHFLSRTMPAIRLGAEEQKDFTKVVKPKIPEGVKYLVAGHPQSMSEGKGVKRKQSESSQSNIQSLEERLALLNSKSELDKSIPKTDTLAQLLVQGLHSKDQSILRSVLDREDPHLIQNTVKSLPVEYIVPLLSTLHKCVQNRSSGCTSFAAWTQAVISIHAGYLISAPNVQKEILLPLHDLVAARAANYLNALKLKGMMEMIKAQMDKNKDGLQIHTDKPAILVYQDESDDNSDAGDNNLPPQGDDDSDYLDDYLSNEDENISSSDEKEEEDVMEDIEENGTVFVNGHTSDMEDD